MADLNGVEKEGAMVCARCSEPFVPRKPWQKFCGSAKRKQGCSYASFKARRKAAAMRSYINKKKKEKDNVA